MALVGLHGHAYLDLEVHLARWLGVTEGELDATLAAVHDEVCLALTQVPVDYTGGSHRSMGITPTAHRAACLGDYGEAIARMTAEEFATFRSLADDPASIEPELPAEARRHAFGEEREHPLSRRQMLWLKVRFGVYFPWKAYLELIPNRYWDDKTTAKPFTRTAQALFPRLITFVRSLPLDQVGRCNVMGLESHDHGTVHRDGLPEEQQQPDHFLMLCPAANKRLFLWDDATEERTTVNARVFWFNDRDYHGVDADPFFRYSIRIDGVFRPEFLDVVTKAVKHP